MGILILKVDTIVGVVVDQDMVSSEYCKTTTYLQAWGGCAALRDREERGGQADVVDAPDKGVASASLAVWFSSFRGGSPPDPPGKECGRQTD